MEKSAQNAKAAKQTTITGGTTAGIASSTVNQTTEQSEQMNSVVEVISSLP